MEDEYSWESIRLGGSATFVIHRIVGCLGTKNGCYRILPKKSRIYVNRCSKETTTCSSFDMYQIVRNPHSFNPTTPPF
jgi:hypothetical protein